MPTNPNFRCLESYNLEKEFETFIKPLQYQILQFSEVLKLPMMSCFQTSPDEFIVSLMSFENRSDVRFYTLHELAQTGCPGWTTIHTKTKKQYDLLKQILNQKLIELQKLLLSDIESEDKLLACQVRIAQLIKDTTPTTQE